MSTISDALKKKRDEDEQPSKEAATPRVVEVHVPKDHSARNVLLVTLLGIALLTGGIVGGYVLLGRLGAFDRRSPASESPPAERAPVVRPEDTPATGSPATSLEPDKDPLARLRLEGIFSDPLEPRAVISGRTLKLGDTVEGFTLVSIQEDRVTLEREDERHELVLE